MIKTIEEQAREFVANYNEIDIDDVDEFSTDLQLYLEGAKARDAQWSAVVNELKKSMEFIHKKVGSCAYSQIDKWGCEMESVYRSSQYSLTKADQMLKEMNINKGEENVI